jgi:thiol:disulfide interchange protein DsbD
MCFRLNLLKRFSKVFALSKLPSFAGAGWLRLPVLISRNTMIVGLTLLALSSSRGQPVEAVETTLELISEQSQIMPGQTFSVAVQFEMNEHWHVYWVNPGASGLPPEIVWDLPEGFSAGDIIWPAPEKIELEGLVTYGYEGTLTLEVPIKSPEAIEPGQPIRIGADVHYLICKDICLPGSAELSIKLPVADGAKDGPHAAEFAAARALVPEEGSPWALLPQVDDTTMTVTVQGEDLPDELYFFAATEGLVDPNAPQHYKVEDGVGYLNLALDYAFFEQETPALEGVLQSADRSWWVEIPSKGDSAAPVAASGSAPSGSAEDAAGLEQRLLDSGLAGWMLLAFLGGVILNVMPCVLPVLSLKVFSLLNHAGQSRSRALAHGWAYTMGVVLSFVLLAVVLFSLRALGEQIGWGFQLQNPSFVLVLVLVFFLFALNLFGVFEIGGGLVGADAKVAGRRDLAGSFGVGVLAAVVGAPCVGPFVGGVSGVALQASTLTGVGIFAMLGLGMAFPFLVLATFPKLVAYLPKPGVWMETFKQAMGFLMMAAVVFLLYVIGSLAGLNGITAALIVVLIAGLAGWILGRWGAPAKSSKQRGIARLLAIGLIVGVFLFGNSSVSRAYAELVDCEPEAASETGMWVPWSPEAVQASLDQGRPVFIDFTATWCLICQVNKRTALRTDSTEALFAEYNVATFSADWTRYDPAITAELERFERSGVPLYILYAPGGEVRVLPQSLTNGIIRKAVEEFLDSDSPNP